MFCSNSSVISYIKLLIRNLKIIEVSTNKTEYVIALLKLKYKAGHYLIFINH